MSYSSTRDSSRKMRRANVVTRELIRRIVDARNYCLPSERDDSWK